MGIININWDMFRGEIIGKTFLFDDDTSVSTDLYGNVEDMDGMYDVPHCKLTLIKNHFNN